jgi:hypothetical protein
MVEYYVLMYENGKMRPVETIPGMGGRGIKDDDGGVNLTKIYCKHFCTCHNVPPAPQYNLKKKRKNKKKPPDEDRQSQNGRAYMPESWLRSGPSAIRNTHLGLYVRKKSTSIVFEPQ